MIKNYRSDNRQYWNSVYKGIKDNKPTYDLWLDKFHHILMKYKDENIVDLGCGSGSDTLYLAQRGFKITACDYSREALKIVRDNITNVDIVEMDFTKPFEFKNESIGLIIADLCLHYFSEEVTFNIISELKRVLRKNCHIILRVNSINDINYGAKDGEEIEKHFYLTKYGYKRFFDENDIRYFFKGFDFEYLKEDSMERYGSIKKVLVVLLRK